MAGEEKRPVAAILLAGRNLKGKPAKEEEKPADGKTGHGYIAAYFGKKRPFLGC